MSRALKACIWICSLSVSWNCSLSVSWICRCLCMSVVGTPPDHWLYWAGEGGSVEVCRLAAAGGTVGGTRHSFGTIVRKEFVRAGRRPGGIWRYRPQLISMGGRVGRCYCMCSPLPPLSARRARLSRAGVAWQLSLDLFTADAACRRSRRVVDGSANGSVSETSIAATLD